VKPFMRVTTYVTRDYATLTRSELPRTFTRGLSCSASTIVAETDSRNTRALVRPQPLYILLLIKQGPVFLVNSRQGYFRCDRLIGGKAYCELTPAFLPSSLTRFHPLTLVLLHQSTCVGLRYGLHTFNFTGFSRQSDV
jgi:hypothetical protein